MTAVSLMDWQFIQKQKFCFMKIFGNIYFFIVALTFPVFYLLRLIFRQSKNQIEPLSDDSLGTNRKSLIH